MAPRRIKLEPKLLVILLIALLAVQAGCGSTVDKKTDDVEATLSGGYAAPDLLIEPDELESRLGEARLVVIDTRPADFYGAGHIPGAVNSDWTEYTYTRPATPNFWQLLPVGLVQLRLGLRGVSRDDEVVVYNDQAEGWGEDGRFFWMLSYLGHEKVRILNGGWSAWIDGGGPTATEASPRPPTLYRVDLRPDILADKAWMVARLGDPEIRFVDSRSAAEYKGTVLSGEARGGHIPGSVNLPWWDTLGADNRIKHASDLERMLDRIAVSPDQEVAVYCTGGVRSGHLFFVMKLLGYPRVRNYDGSYWEWAADPALPVE